MKLDNGLDVSLEKSWYNDNNGISHPMFNLTIYKSYFSNTDLDAVNNLILDLEQLINELKTKENIEIILNSTITKLNGENKLESVDITNNNKETKTIEVEALFIAIGQVPETENFKKLININEQGYVIANEDCKTNIKNIFVAGNNRTKGLRQLVTATSDGAVAATQAIKYINSK